MPTPQEIASLRLFIKKGALFAAPFLLYAALIVALDPFNYFGFSQIVEPAFKEKTAGKLHYSLWKSLRFLDDPKPNLLLGDSRMDLVAAKEAEALTGEGYFNFSYGGGTIPELVDTFWFANDHVDLEKVFVGISFINASKLQSMNRVTETRGFLDNPLIYLTDRIVAKAAFYATSSQLQGEAVAIEKPPVSREAFWKLQLGTATAAHYERYEYSERHIALLRELADYCRENGIRLTFVIPPSHVDLQAKIEEYGLTAEAERFGRDLRSLGRVVDFDFPNDFTRDPANFSDPYHFRRTPMMVEQILSDSPDPSFTR